MNDNDDDDDEFQSSLERARADIEIIQSCYPDEISMSSSCDDCSSFPFQFTLRLILGENKSSLTLRLEPGYPVASGVRIANYRTDHANDKARLEAVIRAVRRVSLECQQDEIEGCMACCAIAVETWNDFLGEEEENDEEEGSNTTQPGEASPASALYGTTHRRYEWISGDPLFDRKSSFQAHICEVHTEQEVKEALHQLLTSSSKIQRATHNMYAWRIAESTHDESGYERIVIKHDNDDDGEDAAGSKMAFLLDMRKDENVLVVVSRWYGGVHLGPKRFAHIVNVARELLVDCGTHLDSK